MQEHHPVPLGMPSSVHCIEHSFIGFPSREKRIHLRRKDEAAQTYHPDAGRRTDRINPYEHRVVRTSCHIFVFAKMFASLVYDPPPHHAKRIRPLIDKAGLAGHTVSQSMKPWYGWHAYYTRVQSQLADCGGDAMRTVSLRAKYLPRDSLCSPFFLPPSLHSNSISDVLFFCCKGSLAETKEVPR